MEFMRTVLDWVRREIIPTIFVVGLFFVLWDAIFNGEFNEVWAGILILYLMLWILIAWLPDGDQ